MGIFTRRDGARPARRRRHLEPEAGTWLAEYGRHDFDASTAPVPSIPATMFLAKLGKFNDGDDSAAVVDELELVANETGGWALYGAEEAVRAFIYSQAGSETHQRMVDARLRFLRDSGIPNLGQKLQFQEQRRYRELFPEGGI